MWGSCQTKEGREVRELKNTYKIHVANNPKLVEEKQKREKENKNEKKKKKLEDHERREICQG